MTWFQTRKGASNEECSRDLPPVSILKPLKGVDDQLEENLHSFFQLDYPEYEIIMGFSDINDEGIDVAERLAQSYPERKSRIIVNHRRAGLNPKINNLMNMYPHARHKHILISDSNVRVSSDYLTDLMHHLQSDGVGMVTSAIRGMEAQRLGAVLENLHLNSFIISSVFAAHKVFRIPISIGKSMLLKKETLRRIGGFERFKDLLAEDHMISEAIRKLGLRVAVSPNFVNNINQNWSVRRFLNRHSRWAKMRKTSNLLYYFSEAFANPIALAALYALILPGVMASTVLASTVALKILLDGLIIAVVRSDLRWYHLALIPAKDILIGFAWLTPFISNTVNWRGNLFKISKHTHLRPLTQGG